MNSWEMPKSTGSYADALAAIGFAHLVNGIDAPLERRTFIKDVGDHFEIVCNPGVDETQVRALSADPGYRYIKFKQTDEVPTGVPVFDYEDARAIEKRYREFVSATRARATKRGKRRPDLENAIDVIDTPPPPPPELQVIKSFNALRMGSDSYNNLHRALSKTANLGAIVAKYLGFQSTQSADEKPLSSAVSCLQFFNPIAGKGVNRAKPDGVVLGSLPDRYVDWFGEWMKFRALHIGLVSWQIGDDTKVMVLSPGEIEVWLLEDIRMSLLRAGLWGSIVLDIRGALATARALISHSEELRTGGRFRFAGNSPRQIISGLYVAYFKSLGTASAVTNLSFIGLPGWFSIGNRTDAEDWLAILNEHDKAVRSLNESHSEDVRTLLLYRDCISSGSLDDALAFFVDYNIGMMRKMAAGNYSVCFTTANLRRLLMSYPTTKQIIENPGFLAVSAAIRRSTIKAQIRKARTGRVVFDVQYGLAQDWKRRMKHRNEFVKGISDFVQQYNAETARHAEQDKEMRPYLRTNEVDQLLDLIKDDQSSELVGMLLLAYGYALEPKEVDENEDK